MRYSSRRKTGRLAQQVRRGCLMSIQDDAPKTPEDAGLSPTPTTGLSENGAANLYADVTDPNAAAMNENAKAALLRQLTGDPPGSESARNPDGLPSTESEEFQDGT